MEDRYYFFCVLVLIRAKSDDYFSHSAIHSASPNVKRLHLNSMGAALSKASHIQDQLQLAPVSVYIAHLPASPQERDSPRLAFGQALWYGDQRPLQENAEYQEYSRLNTANTIHPQVTAGPFLGHEITTDIRWSKSSIHLYSCLICCI